MPNVFTPDANGVNDLLTARHSGVSSFKLIIKNRLGKTIFETTEEVIWDGHSITNGRDIPSDNYLYCLEFTSNNGEKFSKKGKISILDKIELYRNGFTEKYCFDNYENCVFEFQWQGDTLPLKPVSESGEYFGPKCE